MKISRKRITQYFYPLPNREQEQKEWDSFDNSVQKDDAFWENTWVNIQQQKKRITVIRRIKQLAAAAALTGVLSGSYYWFIDTRSTPATATIAAAKFKVITNTTTGAMDLVLEDRTTITLFAASTLRYEPGFPGQARNIYLEGTALFNVQPDATKPFTVFSNSIATKVLGTTFKVAATDGDKTKVYLYKGKVMIHTADSLQVKLPHDYYLSPGDVFSYDHHSGIAAMVNTRPPAGKEATEHNSHATVSNWYQFDNQELPQVLDQLSAIYNVSIHYNPADLTGINFIGKIDRTDSLENVLKDIALLNNLKVVNNGKNYSIKKQ